MPFPAPGESLIFDLYLLGVVGVIFLCVFMLWRAEPRRRRSDFDDDKD